ncbi:MAG: single-stranded DNA-binding protein [Phycisphaerae bacterium]
MANFNKVILAGNLTRDPELSYTPNSTAICKFGMAINRNWRGQDGEKHEETCFVDLTAFGRQAETLNQYMKKGRPLLVEGRLNYSQWTSQEGQKRSKLEVVINAFQFLGGPRDGDASRQPAAAPASAAPADDYQAPPPSADGDIPF